jgi:hypothetical protein
MKDSEARVCPGNPRTRAGLLEAAYRISIGCQMLNGNRRAQRRRAESSSHDGNASEADAGAKARGDALASCLFPRSTWEHTTELLDGVFAGRSISSVIRLFCCVAYSHVFACACLRRGGESMPPKEITQRTDRIVLVRNGGRDRLDMALQGVPVTL